MKPVWLIVWVALLLSSCASTQRTTSGGGTDGPTSITNERDGTSFEKAIVVNSVREEYEWVRDHHPEAQMKQQSLSKHKRKYYDILTFVMPDGSERDFYFDISRFYGKGF